MAIDFEALRKKAAEKDKAANKENGGKIIDPNYQQKKVARDEMLAAKEEPKLAPKVTTTTTVTPNGKTVSSRKRTVSAEVQDALQKAQGEYAIPKFMRNTAEAMFDNSLLGLGNALVTGEKLSDANKNSPYYEEQHSGLAASAGQIAGASLSFMAQSALASPLTGRAGVALADTKLGQAVARRLGQPLTSGLAENAVDALTIGALQNTGMAAGQGLKGAELGKQVAKDTLLDLGIGSVLQGATNIGSIRGAKNADLPTAKPAVEEVVEPTVKQAETVDLGGRKANTLSPRRTTLPTAEGNTYRVLAKDQNGKFGTVEVKAKTPEEATKKLAAQGYEVSRKSQKKYQNITKSLSDGKIEYTATAKNLLTGKTEKVNVKANSSEDAMQKLIDNNYEPQGKVKAFAKGDNVYKVSAKNVETGRYERFEVKANSKEYAIAKLSNYEVSPKNVKQVELPAKKKLSKPERKLKANGIPEVHEKVNGFEVESSNVGQAIPDVKVGIVNPDLKYVNDVIENGEGLFRKFYRYAVSGQEGLERLAKASGDTRVDDYTQGVRSAKSTVTNIFNNGMFDSAGKKIDNKSYKDLIDAIPKKDREAFNIYAQHLHNIDRVREGVPVFKQYSEQQSQQIVNNLLKQHPEFANYTKDINEWWNKFVKTWLLDTGRITKESYDAMLKKYPNYIPTYRKGKGASGIGSLPNRANVGSGIRKAKGGESDVLPLEDNFLAQIDRIVTSTRKNDLYASLIDTLKKDPEGLKQYGVLTEGKDVLNDTSLDDLLSAIEKEGLKEVKDGTYMVTAYVDGKPVSAYVNESIMDALKLLDNAYGSKYTRFLGETGRKITNPIKAGITGYNPLFILANMSRDFPTYFIQSQHGIAKNITGLGKAVKGMLKNDDIFQTYKAVGGKQGGYYAQGKGFEDALNEKGLKAAWSKFEGLLSVLGEGAETLPRFAEFINSVEKYGDSKDGLMKALKDASEVTVNFSRSAPITKTIDGWVLYLNAAVQGLDKFGRSVKNAPLKTLGKSAAVVTLPYVALMAANWDNPHYQDLTERIKQNYFCIPNIFGEKDSEGNCMTFIKLPINREYGALLGSSLDVMYGLVDGQTWEEATKGYKETLSTNFAPPSLEDNVFSAFKDIKENKNYAGNKIVPASLEEADPKYQQDVKTSGLAKAIAKGTNNISEKLGVDLGKTVTSPMKVDYLIDQYGGYIGSVAQGATGSNVDSVGTALEGGIVDPFKQRFSADARYSSGVVSDFYDAKDENTKALTNAKLEGKAWSEAAAKNRVYNSVAESLSENTKKEKEILGNKNLTKKQKNERIKVLRQERNEIARSAEKKVEAAAKEYKAAPTYSQLNTKTKAKYVPNKGLTKEQWAKAYNSQVKEDKHTLKVMNMLDNGVKTYEQAATFNSQLSENAFKEGKALKDAGVTSEQVKKAYVKANTDNSTNISKAEAIKYLDGTNYNRAQKRAIFNALMSNPKTKNPY
jgi:hypothetical protein